MEKRFPAIFGIITLVLLCAGAFSPGWFAFDTAKVGASIIGERHYTSDGIEVHMGLFYFVAVGEDFRKVAGYGDLIGSSVLTIGLLEYQLEVILGILLCFISVILTFTYKKEGSNGVLVAIFIMYIIAGISTFLAVGRWLKGVMSISTYYSIPMIVPYSLILSGLGAIFCGILMINVSRMHCKQNAARQAQTGQVATAVYGGPPPYEQGPTPYGQHQEKHSIVKNYEYTMSEWSNNTYTILGIQIDTSTPKKSLDGTPPTSNADPGPTQPRADESINDRK
ncbi:unnamed protein product [Mytilus coruscus]|uniref:Uncharacterized protein n=1 Tax=Mytilus coruscus TaxID=42192 RepID=A0A6J8CUV2_MYTCO|nr:unnamed protein product [Mytilus coruscus]